MDLVTEADRLRLDILAVALSEALTSADVPHALIKGPSTSTWLYAPPRAYRDVDLLVPRSQVDRAALVLSRAGLAEARSGGIGEEASHALLLHSTEGFEVDLHLSLPAVPTRGDEVWSALEPHLETLPLDVGDIPALDEVGRCLVLALHSVGSQPLGQAAEDLRRARRVTADATWGSVKELASTLGVLDLVEAGIARAEGRTIPLSRRARLYLTDAPEVAFGLQRLTSARARELPLLVLRELVPSRGFMAYDAGRAELRGRELFVAHLRRWRRLIRQVPSAWRALRAKG